MILVVFEVTRYTPRDKNENQVGRRREWIIGQKKYHASDNNCTI